MHLLTVIAKGIGKHAATEPDGVANNRLEHRLSIGLRLSDHAEDFAGRPLSLQRLLALHALSLQARRGLSTLCRGDRERGFDEAF